MIGGGKKTNKTKRIATYSTSCIWFQRNRSTRQTKSLTPYPVWGIFRETNAPNTSYSIGTRNIGPARSPGPRDPCVPVCSPPRCPYAVDETFEKRERTRVTMSASSCLLDHCVRIVRGHECYFVHFLIYGIDAERLRKQHAVVFGTDFGETRTAYRNFFVFI